MIALCIAVYAATLRGSVIWGGSGSDLSDAIIGGLQIIGQPAHTSSSAVQTVAAAEQRTYPVLYSLLQAGVFQSTGFEDYFKLSKQLNLILLALALLVLQRYLSHRFGADIALGVIVAFCTAPYLFEFKEQIRSEFAFMLVLYSAFYWFDRLDRVARPAVALPLAMLLIVSASGLRTVGLLLVPTLLMLDYSRHRRIRWSIAVVIGFACLCYAGLNLLLSSPPESGYAQQFSLKVDDLIVRIKHNLLHYHWALLEYFSTYSFNNSTNRLLSYALYAPLLVCAAIGVLQNIRERLSAAEIFFLLYFLLLLSHETTSAWNRYLIPFMPFFLAYGFIGIKQSIQMLGPHFKHGTSAIVGVVFIVILSNFATFGSGLIDFGEFENGPTAARLQPMLNEIRTKLPAEARVVFREPGWLYLATGRAGVASPRPQIADHGFEHYLSRSRASHVLLKHTDRERVSIYGLAVFDREDSPDFRQYIYSRPAQFESLLSNMHYSLYRYHADPSE